jgi:hypothetical protein
MNEKPRRRWLRFGLRTLFVSVTLLCCWLGWETSVVRERKAVMAEYQANGMFHFTPAAEYTPYPLPGQSPPPSATVPWVRRWLGDAAIQQIWFYRHGYGPTEADIQRVTRVFPEAEMHESLPEPCHPGCFPRGTAVDTPSGPRRIESIQPGDLVISIQTNGEPATIAVQAVFVTENVLWKVVTEDGALITTQTQPLCLATDQTRRAGELRPSDTILQRRDGVLRPVRVLEVSSTDRMEKVFNLVLGDREVFIANGYLARSKPPLSAFAPRKHALSQSERRLGD